MFLVLKRTIYLFKPHPDLPGTEKLPTHKGEALLSSPTISCMSVHQVSDCSSFLAFLPTCELSESGFFPYWNPFHHLLNILSCMYSYCSSWCLCLQAFPLRYFCVVSVDWSHLSYYICFWRHLVQVDLTIIIAIICIQSHGNVMKYQLLCSLSSH